MDYNETWGIIAFAITIIVLISASISDWKKREVSDIHWAIMGVAGVSLFFTYSVLEYGFKWEYFCLAVASLMALLDILWDRDRFLLLFYLILAFLFAIPLYYLSGDPLQAAWASIPVCYLLFVGMYIFGIIKGGADVKCLIGLSMMFAVYPTISMFPIIEMPESLISDIFVFSISALLWGAIMSCFMVAYYVFVNLKEGNKDRRMFTGYMMRVSKAKCSHVWPIEDVVDGEIVSICVPQEEQEVFQRLKEAGCEKVWVTPMIPFIIPITIATVFLIIVGNPLFLIG